METLSYPEADDDSSDCHDGYKEHQQLLILILTS
jgi:hypothetical protein